LLSRCSLFVAKNMIILYTAVGQIFAFSQLATKSRLVTFKEI